MPNRMASMKKVTLWQGFQIFILYMVALFLDMFYALLINDLGLVKALLCLLIRMFIKFLGTIKSVVTIIWPLMFNTKDQSVRFRMMQSIT